MTPPSLDERLRREAGRLRPSSELRPRILAALRAQAAPAERHEPVRRTGARSSRPFLITVGLLAAAAALLLLLRSPEVGTEPDAGEPVVQRTPDRGVSDPIRELFASADRPLVADLVVRAGLGRDPLREEAWNLLSDASRAAVGFVRALPAPLRVGLPH